ncbi:hypothetical protein Bca101_088141 [Brassica carinata]
MLVKSLEVEDHISHLQQAFSTLRKYNMKLNSAKCSFGVSSGKFHGYIVTHRGIEANPEKIRAIHAIPSPRNVKEIQKLSGRMAALSRLISRLSDKSHAFFGTLKNPKDFQCTEECESALHELKAYLTTPPLLSKPLLSEVLLLYLGVSEHAVSAVLICEEGSKQLPIYYVNKALLDAETRYCHLEKLALGMIVATRKLRPYIQAHPFVVVTSFPIKLVLHKPEVSRRLAKWVVELGEYDLWRKKYASEAKLKKRENGSCNFKATNNESEYEALIAGLTLAHQMGVENIQVFGDSQLIINKVLGEYQEKDDSMIQYLAVVQRLIKKFKKASRKILYLPGDPILEILLMPVPKVRHTSRSS